MTQGPHVAAGVLGNVSLWASCLIDRLPVFHDFWKSFETIYLNQREILKWGGINRKGIKPSWQERVIVISTKPPLPQVSADLFGGSGCLSLLPSASTFLPLDKYQLYSDSQFILAHKFRLH